MSSGLSKSQMDELQTITTVSSILTLIASGLMATHILYNRPGLKKSRNDEKILFALALVNILSGLAKVFGQRPIPNEAQCKAQASLIEWTNMAAPIFDLALSINFWYILCKGGVPKHFTSIYMSLGLVIPTICMLIGLFLNSYGNSTLWCWIVNSRNDLRYGIFYIPLWGMIAASLCFTALGVRTVFLTEKSSGLKTYQHTRTACKAFLYALCFVITWTGATINRTTIALTGTSSYPLWIIHALLGPMGGFLLALVYFGLKFFRPKAKKGVSSDHRSTTNLDTVTETPAPPTVVSVSNASLAEKMEDHV